MIKPKISNTAILKQKFLLALGEYQQVVKKVPKAIDLVTAERETKEVRNVLQVLSEGDFESCCDV
jgi:hypothetical protein